MYAGLPHHSAPLGGSARPLLTQEQAALFEATTKALQPNAVVSARSQRGNLLWLRFQRGSPECKARVFTTRPSHAYPDMANGVCLSTFQLLHLAARW